MTEWQKFESTEGVTLRAKFAEGNNGPYLGLEVPPPNIQLPEENLKNRGEWHITIISPTEYPEIKKRWKLLPESVPFSTIPTYVGIGKVEDKDNATYFIVVDWPEAQKFRNDNGLPPADLHITLGFRKKDIYDKPKDRSTLIQTF